MNWIASAHTPSCNYPIILLLALYPFLNGCYIDSYTRDTHVLDEKQVDYDYVLNLFGVACFPEETIKKYPGLSPCDAGYDLQDYFAKRSHEFSLLPYLQDNGMICQVKAVSAKCEAKRDTVITENVNDKPYAREDRVFRITVVFRVHDGPYDPGEIEVAVRRFSPAVDFNQTLR